MCNIGGVDVTSIDLNLLKAFEALMSERSVTRAGGRIGLTQPAMSHALTRLRLVFADELFVRTPGGMAPTPRAEELAPLVGGALHQVRAALQRAAPFDPGTSLRSFSAGMAEYAEIALVEQVAAAFAARAPSADLRLVSANRADFAALLDAGAVDVAVARLPDIPPHFEQRTLYHDRLVLLARAGHPTAGPEMRLQDYAALSHVLVSPTGDRTGSMDRALAAMGLQRRVALVVGSYLALPLALRNSDLVATAPRRAAARLAELAGLAMHEIPLPREFAVNMVWHRRHGSDAGNAWFRSVLEAAGAS
jgi:DNA-binding transcriptional LysR family regulator